jgi:hypothetical protein
VTTIAGARATASACAALMERDLTVKTLQEYHRTKGARLP